MITSLIKIMSNNCIGNFSIPACFVGVDGVETPLVKIVKYDDVGGNQFIYYQSSDTNMTPIQSTTNLNGVDGAVFDRECRVKYETTRTPFCTTDDPRLPKYLVGYSDGTTAVLDPINGEGDWCDCDC